MSIIDKPRYNSNINLYNTLSKGAKISIGLLSSLLFILSIFLPLLLSTYSIPNVETSKSYRVGELSDETIYSPMDFSYIDTVATEELYQEAVDNVLPELSYSISNSIRVRNVAEEFVSVLSTNPKTSIEDFLLKHEIVDSKDVFKRLNSLSTSDRLIASRLIYECAIDVCNAGLVFESDIDRVESEGYDRVVIETIDEDFDIEKHIIPTKKLLTRDSLPKYILSWVAEFYPNTKSSVVDLIVDGVDLLVVENINYDEILTKMLEEHAKNNIAPVLIEVKKGDELLSKDKIVTSQMLRTIEMMNQEATIKIRISETIGKVFYLATIIFLFLYLFSRGIQHKYRVATYLIIILVMIIAISIVEFFTISYLVEHDIVDIDAWLPFFILPMLASSMTNKKSTGVITGVFFASLQNVWPTSNIYTFFYIVTCCVVVNYFIRFNNERIGILIQSLVSATIVSVVTLIFALLVQLGWRSTLISVLGSAINVIFAHFLLSILLPIMERLFNIPTGYRLHELSYTDTPTLNRLNQVALGTYNHSKNVSDMAYVAAKAIGANAELARVGALYHDIGKSEHPEYFVENQTGKNAHDEISPSLSVAIIKSHLKIGIEKAKDIGLPQEVIDIISEHHGNDLIKYFYNEAMKNSKVGSAISEEDFRYSGRIPSTPESAIVMLSDCVEAATRTIKNPNHQKYDKFISNIISDKISHKQLNNSQLTLTDLDKIKQTFIHQLMGRDHHRIEYDNDK